ncbi:single-stranded DNA-binding protein [Deinococcus altitudinis]|uniref:single-stranded DNA-binding protein n=1 Tax=Deinococcus altitudinis TaxID=468914 RepID=UPI00389267B3
MPETERQRADQQGNLSQATEALRGSLTDWATVRVQADRALVLPVPDLDALYAGLERTLDGDWTIRYAVEQMTPPVVRASLHLGERVREGVAEGHTLTDARLLALADALRACGVLPASSEGQWVEYDPEEGANIHELEPQAPVSARPGRAGEPSAALPPAPPRDPQLERARKHIDDLLEGLRDAGQGKAAALVLAQRGYGNTLEESREVYKELKALKG